MEQFRFLPEVGVLHPHSSERRGDCSQRVFRAVQRQKKSLLTGKKSPPAMKASEDLSLAMEEIAASREEKSLTALRESLSPAPESATAEKSLEIPAKASLVAREAIEAMQCVANSLVSEVANGLVELQEAASSAQTHTQT